MTKHDFILWLKGFMDGTNKHQPTPKQWEQIREKLDEVEMEELTWPETTNPPSPFSAPFQPYINPYTSPSTDPYKVTCDGTSTGKLTQSHSAGLDTITLENSTTDTTIGYPEGTQFSYTTKQEE